MATTGATKAAEIIMGDDDYIVTTYGRKSRKGISNLIDDFTGASELVTILSTILDVYDKHKIIGPTVYADARAILAKAEGDMDYLDDTTSY